MNEKAKLISVGELFRQSWQLYKERFWSLFGIIILGFIVTMAVVLGVVFGFAAGEESTATLVAMGVILITLFLSFFVLSGLAMIYAIPQGIGVRAAYSLAFKNFISFGWLGILRALTTLGGVFMLIVPGIIFAVWFTFASYIFAFDKERGMNALLKSKSYMSGYWWQVVGRFMIVFLVYFPISLLVSFLGELLLGETVGGIVSTMFEVLASIFWVLALYVLYQSLKTVKPDVADEPASGPKGFFYFSAVLGLVGLIIAGVLFFKYVGPGFLSEIVEPETLPVDYGASESVPVE